MKFRRATKNDYEAIKQLHKTQPFKYSLPDLSELVDIQVLVDEQDNVVMALCAKKVIEYYLIMDHQHGSAPSTRWGYIVVLIRRSLKALGKKGWKQVFCFLPDEIAKSFGKRLVGLGMKCFSWTVLGGDIPEEYRKKE